MRRSPSPLACVITICALTVGACGRVSVEEHPLSDGGLNRISGFSDAHAQEAAADVARDSRVHDVGADVEALESTAPDSSTHCTAEGEGCEDGGVCQAGVCKMCRGGCTSDEDCSSQCPSIPGMLSCCDVTSGVCFTSGEAMCPDQWVECNTSADCASGSCCNPFNFVCEASDAACPPTTCASECSSNSECEERCPAAPSGLKNCCGPGSQQCEVASMCFGDPFPDDAGADGG
jgi:hypothetical protein